MKVGKSAVLAIAVIALLAGAGCKKKPKLPPQTQPPTVTEPTPETTPPEQPPVETTPPVTTPPVTEPEPQPVPPAPKPKPHAKKKKPHVPAESKPTEAKSTPKPGEPKTTENVQISAEVPQNVANQRRQQTEALLNAAEDNLKKINYSMSDGEQSMQRQVRNFITQSRLAIQDGDFERAYNLATKAQQLSQELVK